MPSLLIWAFLIVVGALFYRHGGAGTKILVGTIAAAAICLQVTHHLY